MKIVLVSALLILPAIPLRGPSRAQNASSARQPDSSQTKPFSRAAWIAAHARSLRFSGGVLPATAPPFNPPGVYVPPGSFSSVLPASFMPSLASTQPVQASKDLLPTDTSAEPGTHAEPYLDANQSNPMNLVGGWQENRFANGGARCVTYGTSFDGGQTWTTNLIPHLTVADGGPWERASDPWVAFGPNNRVYYSSLLFNETTPDNAIGVSLSSDGGMTWGDPVEINHVKKQFNDKDAIAADSYPASPHLGNVYAAWDVNNNTGKQWVVVSRSTDAGRTFESPVRLGKKGTENIGAIPRVGPLGTV
ncbi:MAG TPA: sialidase family protein, partial [Blastocatellia bacterium]|nr:sialidase family protein [Blastocatellia bacterium]